MRENTEHLIHQSIKDEKSYSSTTHAIDTIAQEIPQMDMKEYPIPSRYYKDRVTLLPVNQSKYYIYWEITDETLTARGIDLNTQELYFRIYNTKGMLFEFSSPFAVSEYFIKGVFENQKIYAKVGYMVEHTFQELFASQSVQTFSSQINLPAPDDEIWMRKGESWSQLLHSSIEHLEFSGSSAKYIKELERLRYLNKMSQSNESSSSHHQGGNNG